MRRLRVRRLLAVVLLAGFALLGLRGVVRLAFVARDLQKAENLVDDASAALVDGRLRDATRALDRAEGLVLGANEALRDAPELDLVGWVPGFHQNLVALEESVELAATVIHGGVRILGESDPLQSAEGTLKVSLSDGTVPLEAVAAAQQRISELSTHLLPAIRKDAPPLLLPPVRGCATPSTTRLSAAASSWRCSAAAWRCFATSREARVLAATSSRCPTRPRCVARAA